MRYFSFKMQKGQITGDGSEHIVEKKYVKLRRKVRLDDKDLGFISN